MNCLVAIGSTYMPDMPEDLGVAILGVVVGDGGGVGGNVGLGETAGGGRLLLVTVLIISLRKMMSGPFSCLSANPSSTNTESSSALDIRLKILLLGLHIISSSLDDEDKDSLKNIIFNFVC